MDYSPRFYSNKYAPPYQTYNHFINNTYRSLLNQNFNTPGYQTYNPSKYPSYESSYYRINTPSYQTYSTPLVQTYNTSPNAQSDEDPVEIDSARLIIHWQYLIWPNGWLLTPALIGIIGGLILGLLENDCETNSSKQPEFMLLVNVYTIAATAGVSLYVLKNLYMYLGNFGLTFTSIGIGITTAFLLFASIFYYVYRTFPSTFKGDDIGEDSITQYFSFLYLSATAISVGPSGDILPVTSGSRMLMNVEVLYFLFVLSSGLTAFAQKNHKLKIK